MSAHRPLGLTLVVLCACGSPDDTDADGTGDTPGESDAATDTGDTRPTAIETDPPDTDSNPPVDTDEPLVAEPYRRPPYIQPFPAFGVPQLCLIPAVGNTECYRDPVRVCGGIQCRYTEHVPDAPLLGVEAARGSHFLLFHDDDGTADALLAYDDVFGGPTHFEDHPDLLGGRTFTDIGQGGHGYLFGLTPAGRLLALPSPPHGLADVSSFPSTARYVHLASDGETGACALTTDGEIHCHAADGVPFQYLPPVPDPIRRIAIGGLGTGCAITTMNEVYCDTRTRSSTTTLEPAPAAIQGHVHEVAVGASARCATAQDHHPVCWSPYAGGFLARLSEQLIASTPQVPLRALVLGETSVGMYACGTHLHDDTLHCWGDAALLDQIPWGTKHYPPDP